MKNSTKYLFFTATFCVISWKIDYLLFQCRTVWTVSQGFKFRFLTNQTQFVFWFLGKTVIILLVVLPQATLHLIGLNCPEQLSQATLHLIGLNCPGQLSQATLHLTVLNCSEQLSQATLCI